MELIKCNILSDERIMEIENFIYKNDFNNGISFLENDMNYYEDFPCFFMLYDNNTLIAFLSVFIPDSASCEIYYHVSDDAKSNAYELYNIISKELKLLLDEYELFNQYILFDSRTTNSQNFLGAKFSHSECLMQYNQAYNWTEFQPKLEYELESDNDTLLISTFLGHTYVGSCKIETSGDYALIHDVYVEKEFRGLGYGKETLFHTINHLVESGHTNILLHVNSANTIAFTMYSHYGFNIKQQIDYWKIDINQAT